MRIISLDPGYERLGVAVIEKNNKEKLLFSGCIQTSAQLPFQKRLKELGLEVEKVIQKYSPKVMALETLFFNSNQKTAMHVAEVRGALMYIAQKENMDVYEYTPLQVKNAITGHGGSDKQQMMDMLPHLISIEKEIQYDDEFDAIAVGLTCSASERFEK